MEPDGFARASLDALLSARQWKVLSTVGEQRTAAYAQIEQLVGGPCGRELSSLVRAGLLMRYPLDGREVWVCTAAGAAVLGPSTS